jgi:hypothetical protein
MKQYLLSVYQPEGGTPPREGLEKVMREIDAGGRTPTGSRPDVAVVRVLRWRHASGLEETKGAQR